MLSIDRQAGIDYVNPSRKTVRKYVNIVCDILKVRCCREHLMVESINVTSDAWSDFRLRRWVAVTGHFIDKNWTLHRELIALVGPKEGLTVGTKEELAAGALARQSDIYDDIATELLEDEVLEEAKKMAIEDAAVEEAIRSNHTAANIVDTIESALSSVNLGDHCLLGSVTTDNGANFIRAARELAGDEQWACVCHTLQLVIREAIKPGSQIQTDIQAVHDNVVTASNNVFE